MVLALGAVVIPRRALSVVEERHVTVLGSGSWGTALADHLARAGYRVRLWGRDRELVRVINERQENYRYFPGISLSSRVKGYTDLRSAITGSELIVFCVPSSQVQEMALAVKPHVSGYELVVSTSKGLDKDNLERMSVILKQVLGDQCKLAVLSGPSFALEVLQGKPTAVTCAAESIELAELAAKYFHFNNFRVYTSTDLRGVEYSGALKNVIAVAVGILDGLNVGLNARAALMTRGLAEIQRFVSALGGDRQTVVGLSGLGDLLLTATGELSRNRRVGVMLGEGRKLDDILKDLGQVAEGVHNAQLVYDLATRKGLQMPIVEEVYRVIKGEHRVSECVQVLLSRSRKSE